MRGSLASSGSFPQRWCDGDSQTIRHLESHEAQAKAAILHPSHARGDDVALLVVRVQHEFERIDRRALGTLGGSAAAWNCSGCTDWKQPGRAGNAVNDDFDAC
jgi:hypothetical protein